MTELRERAEWLLRADRELRESTAALGFIATDDDATTAVYRRAVDGKRQTLARANEAFVTHALIHTPSLRLAEIVAVGERALEQRAAAESQRLAALEREQARNR